MLNQRLAAAKIIFDKLIAAEDGIDEAIRLVSDLSGTMPSARRDANISAIVGHDALESATATISALVAARAEIVRTHERLSEAKDSIGLRTYAAGAGHTKPEPLAGRGDSREAAHLSVVGNAA
ncbi:MAG: hypothetical protein AAF205_02025 [Pseudomonadota bacterium]